MELEPLTSEQLREKRLVKASYGDFWNHLKFRQGWEEPAVEKDDMDDILDKAAEIVVRIRTHLDRMDPSVKFRMVGGASQEFLWTVDPSSLATPQTLLNDLVHATFRDASGYVEGLTKETLQQYIDQALQYMESHPTPMDEDEQAYVRETLEKLAKETSELVQAIQGNEARLNHPSQRRLLERAEKGVREANALLKQLNREIQEEAERQQKVEEEKQKLAAVELQKQEEKQKKKEELELEEAMARKQRREEQEKNEKIRLEIKQVADDVDGLRKFVASLKEDANAIKVEDLSDESALTKLQQKVLESSEKLMKELLVLDTLVDASNRARSKRKEQVKVIQSLLEDVDSISDKVKNLRKIFKQQQEQKVTEELVAAAAAPRGSADVAMEDAEEVAQEAAAKDTERRSGTPMETEEHAAAPPANAKDAAGKKTAKGIFPRRVSSVEGAPPFDIDWSKLIFRPQFDVKDRGDSFVIAALIPGMKKEDILIKLEPNNVMNISGVRAPSEEEEAEMNQQLSGHHYYGRLMASRRISDEDRLNLLLRMAAGRYGKFDQRFQFPVRIDEGNIEASYDRGILKVTVPKVVRRPNPAAAWTPYGYAERPFYGDRDYFW